MACMPRISIDEELLRRCPAFSCGAFVCDVRPHADARLFHEMLAAAVAAAAAHPIEAVRSDPVIAATRRLYRLCGKEPNRYRPAAEQLRRRAVRGLGPFPVHLAVDILNWLSLRTGFSISGVDADTLQGALRWGIGRAGEPFDAIGGGAMNIEGLPVLRDQAGAFASPTRDSVRTRIRPETGRVLATLCAPDGPAGLAEAMAEGIAAMRQYAGATVADSAIIRPGPPSALPEPGCGALG